MTVLERASIRRKRGWPSRLQWHGLAEGIARAHDRRVEDRAERVLASAGPQRYGTATGAPLFLAARLVRDAGVGNMRPEDVACDDPRPRHRPYWAGES